VFTLALFNIGRLWLTQFSFSLYQKISSCK